MAHTHELTFTDATLTKRYRSWQRGEHHREWAVLRQLDRHAAGIAPEPLAADLDAQPPTVTMTVVPGMPLDGTPTMAQFDALTAAITELWSVPHTDLPAACRWTDDLHFARMLTAGPRPAGGVTALAYDAAIDWWDGPDPRLLRSAPNVRVLGHRDPNLANYLWDGERVRIVDFEDSAVSDPATEVAILAEHLSARHLDPEAVCGRFDVDRLRLRAARRAWAMFWLRLLLPGGPAERRNPPGTTDDQARRLLALLET